MSDFQGEALSTKTHFQKGIEGISEALKAFRSPGAAWTSNKEPIIPFFLTYLADRGFNKAGDAELPNTDENSQGNVRELVSSFSQGTAVSYLVARYIDQNNLGKARGLPPCFPRRAKGVVQTVDEVFAFHSSKFFFCTRTASDVLPTLFSIYQKVLGSEGSFGVPEGVDTVRLLLGAARQYCQRKVDSMFSGFLLLPDFIENTLYRDPECSCRYCRPRDQSNQAGKSPTTRPSLISKKPPSRSSSRNSGPFEPQKDKLAVPGKKRRSNSM